MRKIVLWGCVTMLAMSLVGCGGESENLAENDTVQSIGTEEYAIDYIDAKTFESALNDGVSVKGKTVQFDVVEYEPESALGINCWSGEHLNFISEIELDVQKGDIVVGCVTKEPSKILGSWKIPYEALKINSDDVAKETSVEETMIAEATIEETTTEEDTNFTQYNIGDEVELGGEIFNIYKIDEKNNELYLLLQSSIVTTAFSDNERSSKYLHDYEGSLVEGYINKFVDDLEDKGLVIKSSGIIDKDDLYSLGFKADGMSGLLYEIDNAPEFVKCEEGYWVGGYCKYNTRSWVFFGEKLDIKSCDDEYGVRPVIIIEPSEIGKTLQEMNDNLTIKEIVDINCAWTSEGGIENPYDRFYFDCKKMLFTNIFESSEFSDTSEFGMEFVDEKTIQVDGVMRGYETPAEITIINENKLRLRFLDDAYNDGDYFLNKVNE